jgi:hypothetical protein
MRSFRRMSRNLPSHSIASPTFASELRICAHGMQKPIVVPVRVDSDLENCLRAMHNVKNRQMRKGAYAELVVPFEMRVKAPTPTIPQGTSNASHLARRTATVRQREAATENALIAEVVDEARTQIAAKYACADALCSNNPKACIPSMARKWRSKILTNHRVRLLGLVDR